MYSLIYRIFDFPQEGICFGSLYLCVTASCNSSYTKLVLDNDIMRTIFFLALFTFLYFAIILENSQICQFY